MRRSWIAAATLSLNMAAGAATSGEEASFAAAARLFREARRERSAAADALRDFLARYPRSHRAADAHFALGEIALERALSLEDADPALAKDPAAARLPDAIVKSLRDAQESYELAARQAPDDALRATAQYRVGEAAYDARDWEAAARQFDAVARTWPKSYVAADSLLGLAYAALAREDFVQAEAAARHLAESWPDRAKAPSAALVQGVLALHRSDYAEAEKLLAPLPAPEARFYLGKTYLLWQKPLLAATAFNKLAEDGPVADLREAASFYLGDAFLLSRDFEGAAQRYAAFLRAFPFSRYKAAALFRVGAASFRKGDYGQARLGFGSLLTQYPGDFYAPLARYFIGESYLATDQAREALFAYSDVAARARKDLQPQALFKLAWTQYSLGDFSRSAQGCQNLIDLYPAHPLVKDAYLLLGNSQARQKRPAAAVPAYQRVLDIAPASEAAEEALFLMLKLEYDQKNYGQILTSYQYLLRQLPQSLSHWRALSNLTAAETYLRLNRLEEARGVYELVLKVYPNDLASIYAQDGLAWCHELSGKHREAVEARQRLADALKVENSSFSFAALNDLGIADSFYAQKDYPDAFTFYDRFVAAHPESPAAPAALYRAGFSLYRMKYYSQAIETWRKLLAKSPAAPEAEKASYQIADTLFRAGKPVEAAAAYREILAKAPQGNQAPTALLRLAQIAYEAKDDGQALERARALILGFPKAEEAESAFDLAEAVFDRAPGRDFKAFLSGLVAADPQGASAGEAQFRLGRRLFDRKDYAAAALELERFSVDYTAHPSLAKAQLLLGECHFQGERWEDAEAALERFTINYPKDENVPLALFKLGAADLSLKRYAKSAAAYEKLLAEFPKTEYAQPARFNLAMAYRGNGQPDQAAATYGAYVAAGPGEEQALAALWEVYAIEKERKDLPAQLKALQELRAQAKPGSEADFSAAYLAGEASAAAGDSAGARAAWEAMIPLKPESSPYRLHALVKLSELYEKDSNWAKAIDAYEDIASHATSPAMIAAARDRIKDLKSSAKNR